MVTISDDLDFLTVQEPLFKDVKYYVSGDVSDKVCFYDFFFLFYYYLHIAIRSNVFCDVVIADYGASAVRRG